MNIRLDGRLPFVTAVLTHGVRKITLDRVLIDTGSAGSVFAADEVFQLDLLPEPTDPIRRLRGVGGSEFVFSKHLDSLALHDLEVNSFEIQIGAMDYGFPIQGLVGMDFLLKARAIVDLGTLEIRKPES